MPRTASLSKKAAGSYGGGAHDGHDGAGAAVFIPLALVEGWHTETLVDSLCLPRPTQLSSLLFCIRASACSVLAFFLSNIALASIGVNRTASFIGISTVVAIAAGVTMPGRDLSS